MSKLWYNKPAKEWEEALPLGNGRMGAMVYGGIEKEQIQVNEESIWYGSKKNRNNEDTLKNLPKVRELLFDGKIEEAEQLMKWSFSGCPKSMPSYQTLGDIFIQFYSPAENGLEHTITKETSNYYRELDLERAVSKICYTINGIVYTRESFFSYPADAMIMRFTASKEGELNFTVNLDRCKNSYEGIHKIGQNGLCLYGNLGRGGFEYAMSIKAMSVDGSIQTIGEHLVVCNASEVVLVFSADCTYHYTKEEKEEEWKHYIIRKEEFEEELTEPEQYERSFSNCMQNMLQLKLSNKLDILLAQNYSALLLCHIKDYQSLFGRVKLVLDDLEKYKGIPTDERLELAKIGEEAGLAPIYLDYGRYLMISCSRPGNLPANLQGIWNKELKPSWESKYTININTEMNYWLAESANLPECHMPLFSLIQKMLPNGRKAARELYGCHGFVAHHNTDIFGDCCVQDYWNPGSYWVMGAAWLCTHQWTHYLYTQDIEFLESVFPIMREAAEFFLDFLVEYKGYLVTCPSVSPENTFILKNWHSGANTFGVTMDNQILRDLFEQCNQAAKILGISDALDNKIKMAKEKLYPMQISEKGYLMEWPEDYEEKDKGHRHISHLYGLHPSSQICVDETPELAEAAKKTLERRLEHGGGHTGWSRAWILNHYAKLWDGEQAYQNLIQLFAKSTYPNLFDKHPPFQIDGNFGAAAGIIEMLVQSSETRIVLLPALPKTWKNGRICGICVKGGGIIQVEWKEGKLVKAELTMKQEKKVLVKYQGKECCVDVKKGEEKEILLEDFQ